MTHTLILSTDEALLVIAALHAVAPSGGGSDPFHLACKLQAATSLTPEDRFIGRLQLDAYNEIEEAVRSELEYEEANKSKERVLREMRNLID